HDFAVKRTVVRYLDHSEAARCQHALKILQDWQRVRLMLQIRAQRCRSKESLGETAQPFNAGRVDGVAAARAKGAVGHGGGLGGNLDAKRRERSGKAVHRLAAAAAKI